MCSKPMHLNRQFLNLGTTFHSLIVYFFLHRFGSEVVNRHQPLSPGAGIFAYQEPNSFFLVKTFWSNVLQLFTIIWILVCRQRRPRPILLLRPLLPALRARFHVEARLSVWTPIDQ